MTRRLRRNRVQYPPMKFPLNQSARVDIALLALFAVAWGVYPKNYVFHDQAYYLMRAYDLAAIAGWGEAHLFHHRLGLLLPHYLAYRLFGVSHFTSFLPQLGFLLATLLTALRWRKETAQKICVAAALLPLLPYAADARPDLGVACCMLVAVYCLARRGGGWKPALFGALFALAAFYGFLVKGVGYFIALPYLLVFAADIYRRRMHGGGAAHGDGVMRFHSAAIAAGLALLGAYAVFCQLVFGDVFSRFQLINKIGGEHVWAIHGAGAYLHRFFVQPAAAFYDLLGVALLLALAQTVVSLIKKDKFRLVGVCFLAMILCAVFAPTSLSAYQPLPLHHEDGRFILFLIPPAAILAAKFVGDLFRGEIFARRFHKHRFAPRAAAFALLAVIVFQSGLKPSVFAGGVSEIEAARRAAMRGLMENERTVLALSTGRNQWEFNLYTGFDPALQRRILLCDTARIAEDGRRAIVLIDKRQSAFLLKAYGAPNCDEELIAFAKAQGHTPLIDNRRVYLSFPAAAATP